MGRDLGTSCHDARPLDLSSIRVGCGPERLESRCVLACYGVQCPQFLSTLQTWDPIGNAEWFITRAATHEAVCPAGTTGIAIQMNASPKAI